jgi:hypothetical protein
MRAGWGEGVRPSRQNEQKGTFQPGMKTPNSTKSRAAQCIPESYVAVLMRMCIAGLAARALQDNFLEKTCILSQDQRQ